MAIVWNIWTARNSLKFHDETFSVQKHLFYYPRGFICGQGHMHNSVDDLLCLNRFGITGIEQRLKVQIHVLWSPPSYGWYKVNTDGVSMGNSGLAAAGSVFRDHDASVLTCFSSLLGSFSDFETELLVVCIAVEKVRQLHIPNLWI